MSYPSAAKAKFPFTLGSDVSPERLLLIQKRLDELTAETQYGWGHTIDFGSFKKEGYLGEEYLRIAGLLDLWNWLPKDLAGRSVADVGCFTGGLTLYLSSRNPSTVYAVDEIPEHLQQCAYLAELFGQAQIRPVCASVFELLGHVPEGSLDLILFSGVLYHLSDMLFGLYVLRRLLKPGSTLLIETNAVDDFGQSYANFGRFYAGMWWQPSGLCVRDMCSFMGFEDIEVRFYQQDRCLVRAIRSADEEIPFKRGMNWKFEDILDARPRPMDPNIMAPVRRILD